VTVPDKERQLRRLIVELQMMQGSADLLQQRLELLQTATTDLRVADSSLKALMAVKAGNPILVPVGGNTFVNAQIGELNKVIVGIGADVSIEMDIDKAVEDISARLAEVEKAGDSVQQQLGQILSQMQIHQDGINRLGADLRGEAAGV